MRLWTEKSLRSGRRSGAGAAVCWAVKWALGPLGGESRGREPSACVFPLSLLGRRPGWHAGPSAPGVSGGGGSREPESPEPPRNFGSGGEHFLRAGRRGPGGRGGGQTLRCAPPAGSMRPLLCALAGLALLRAAGEWGRAGRAGGGTEPAGEQRAGEEGRGRAGVGGGLKYVRATER